MAAYERTQIRTLLQRLDEPPERLIVITGPRQTGKTTLVRQTLDRLGRPGRYVPVDEPEPAVLPSAFPSSVPGIDEDAITSSDPLNWLVRQWERARIDADRSERGSVLVLDEIQKVPNWSEAVKGLWDADRRHGRRLHVVLPVSAPLFMQKGMNESLAGRFETLRLTHWSFEEMSAAFDFDLDSYVYFGGYPGGAPLIGDQDRWRAYVTQALIEPNIERDILALQRVDKPALLKRLFELGAEYSGQVLSYTKMLGQLQDAGNTTTLARYLDLLSKAGLMTGLPNYAGGAYRRRASSPKLNVLNTALMAACSGRTFEEAKADRTFWGRLVESTVGAHLCNTAPPEARLHYWRHKGRKAHEVDFVLERGPRLAAFEVKSGARRSNVSGLDEFARRFPRTTAPPVLVGEGGTPVGEFLSIPAREWIDET